MKRDLKETVKNIVNSSGCINGTRLALETLALVHPNNFSQDEYSSIVSQLVHEKELEIVIYYLPNASYPLSVYFPKGTKLRIVNESGRESIPTGDTEISQKIF